MDEAFDPTGIRLADQLMQQEMQSLRRALFEMQRERFEHEHAQFVTDQVEQIGGAQQSELNGRQELVLAQQEAELDQAAAQLSLLQQECARLSESKSYYEELAQRLQLEVHRLKLEQRDASEAQAAENEILRRQLELVEKKAAKLQGELASMQHQAKSESRRLFRAGHLHGADYDYASFGCLATNQALETREQELRMLKDDHEKLRTQLLRGAKAEEQQPMCISPLKPLRPMTAVESTGNRASTSGTNIQRWWSGPPSGIPEREEDESEPNITPAIATNRLFARPSTRDDPTGSRPLRARLVGLLESLEQETNAFKDCLVELEPTSDVASRPVRAVPGMQRKHKQLMQLAPAIQQP